MLMMMVVWDGVQLEISLQAYTETVSDFYQVSQCIEIILQKYFNCFY
jgi:hypothetical protein